MQVGVVVGTAIATVKHPSMEGSKLLVVQFYGVDNVTPDGEPVLAIDHIGAGFGDRVLLTSDGKTVRAMLKDDKTPVRWSVMGIEDQ